MAGCLLIIVAQGAHAAVDVRAKLDSVYLQMGRITTLHLSATQPKGVRGEFPLLRQVNQQGIIPICGDSVELRAPSRIDTVDAGANITVNYEVPVQAFDSGFYRLPQFVYVAGRDSAVSKTLTLKVVPVKATADEPISDYAGTAEPENPSIFDHLPDWLVDYWWLLLIAALIVAAGIYLRRRYKREGHILPKKPEPTPYEKALNSLRTLKGEKLWEQGMEKEYYTRLTEIVRVYLYGRFHINAMEMTSNQILSAITKNKETKPHRVEIQQILSMADFAKFAKIRPLPDDNIKAFDNAEAFVRSTKPLPPVENKPAANQPSMPGGDGKEVASASMNAANKKEKGGEL